MKDASTFEGLGLGSRAHRDGFDGVPAVRIS
jgi:hypothetical protein